MASFVVIFSMNKFVKKSLNQLKQLYLIEWQKKICRKCYRRLPLNSNVCRACKNPDLRTKKEHELYNHYLFDKNTKNKLIDKRNGA